MVGGGGCSWCSLFREKSVWRRRGPAHLLTPGGGPLPLSPLLHRPRALPGSLPPLLSRSLLSSPSLCLSGLYLQGVKLAPLPYHIQLAVLQDIHQHFNLGLFIEEKVIIHPENVFGGDLRYGQVPTSKPAL